ncbi:MAG: DUF418 domain-containing protein [Gemmataceae bacterium]
MAIVVDTTSSNFGPIHRSDRLLNLDFVRGIALLGILLVNIGVMFGPLASITSPATHHSGESALDRAATLFVQTFCQAKFISIFSMLFAYGLLGQFERAEAAGRSAVGFAFRRLLPLTLFGLLHGVFLWYGDILFVYGLMGGWILLARRVPARILLVVAGGVLLFAVFLSVVFAFLAVMAQPVPLDPGEAVPSDQGIAQMLRSGITPDHPVWIASEIEAYRHGPWIRAQEFRLWEWCFNLLSMVLVVGWLVLAMFVVGCTLWRVNYFAPEQAALRQRGAWICLPLGLSIVVLSLVIHLTAPPGAWREALGGMVREAGLLFLPLGYLSGLALLADYFPTWPVRMIASAGKMSLTVYLSETVIATGLAYHWGLGLFGTIGPAGQLAIALGIWATLVVASHLWLRRFQRGPMEWLWRRLEYGPT